MVYHVVPRLCTNVLPCEQGCYYDQYIVYATLAQGYFQFLLTWYLLVDLYHDRFSQDLLMCYGISLVGRSHRKKHQAKGVKKFNPHRSMHVRFASLPPAHLQRCLPMVIDWTLTTELIPYLLQPGHAYGLWSPPAGSVNHVHNCV